MPIVNASTFLKCMEYKYEIQSITKLGLCGSRPDFFKKGTAKSRVTELLPIPLTIYTVLFCPICTRNYIYKGCGSFMALGPKVLSMKDMEQMLFVCCSMCKRTKGYSGSDASISLGTLFLEKDKSIKKTRETLPVSMDIFGASFETERSDYDKGRIHIMHLDKIVDTMADFCTTHSIVENKMTNTVENFV